MNLEQLLPVAIGIGGVVAFDWFQRQQKQPIAPTAPSATAAPAEQTNWLPWVAVAVVAFLFFSAQQQTPSTLKPVVTGILAGVFSTNDNREEAAQDAKKFSELCYSLAKYMEEDANLKQPFLKYGVQFDDVRRRARTYLFNGNTLATKYPKLPTALDTHLFSRLGDSGDKVDAEQRRKWVAAFRELGAGAAEEAK